MSKPRKLIINLKETRYYQCISRCVRQMFLCGDSENSVKSIEHRKQWIQDRIKFLAHHFAIDICSYAIMSNHYHIVLKVNINKIKSLSQDEIILHWSAVFTSKPKMRQLMLYKEQNNIKEVRKIVSEMRKRLMSISWFMSALNQNIAQRANREENCKGKFWDGKFVSQPLLTESAILRCMAYVDLNPVRAGIAKSIEQSNFTSIKERIYSLKKAVHLLLTGKKIKKLDDEPAKSNIPFTQIIKKFDRFQPNGLMPFATKSEKQKYMTALEYINFVDTLGRHVIKDGKAYIKPSTPSISDYLGINIKQLRLLADLQHTSSTECYLASTLKLRPL